MNPSRFYPRVRVVLMCSISPLPSGCGDPGGAVYVLISSTSALESAELSEAPTSSSNPQGGTLDATGTGIDTTPVGLDGEGGTSSSSGEDMTGSSSGEATSSSSGEADSSSGDDCLTDVPDPACEGDAGHVFVAISTNGGDDLNDGLTKNTPVATLTTAVERALACPQICDIVVSSGIYNESVALASGIHIYGGYTPWTFSYDLAANPTTLAGTGVRTLIAEDLTESTDVHGLTIVGKGFTTNGQSSYAVWVKNVADGLFSLQQCTIRGGAGGNGVPGAAGVKGANGGLATPANGAIGGTGGSSSCGAAGGQGGMGNICPATGGEDGAAGNSPVNGGKGADPGISQCGSGCMDEGGNSSASGQVGEPGEPGTGGAANPSPTGSFDAMGFWTGLPGESATAGHHGTGGGGGGAGGADADGFFCGDKLQYGSGGGGGGAGGCGGDAGTPGGAGGSSFAVVVISSSIQIMDSAIEPGAAGNGGAGKNGDNGGLGASGSLAGVSDGEGGTGSAGGHGGDGGGGGGGAGGCGGISVGIARVGGAFAGLTNVMFLPGTPGAAGMGGAGGYEGNDPGKPQAPAGKPGCAGMAADQLDL